MSRNLVPAAPTTHPFDFTDQGTLRRESPDVKREGGAAAETTFATGFYVNDETIGDSFCRALDPLLADWIDIALAAYMSDRQALRRDPKVPGHAFQWARRMCLKISVRHPDVWKRAEVGDALRRALGFFTDDEWEFEFVTRRGKGRLSERQEFLFQMPVEAPVRVALFSGGLDSFAGAARAVADLQDHSLIFVSGATNQRQRSAQREQLRALRRLSARELCHVTVPFGLDRRGLRRGKGEETSQRTRGFLFLTLGAVTALTAGAAELHVHENGVGAINLSYDATQVGTSNSRGVHPLSLLRMGELAEALTGGPFTFHNPYLFQTKGQMCRHPAVRRLADYIPTTFSCDGYPVQARRRPQCGSCTSCLLRRVSLQAAGLSAYDPSDHYVCDLLDAGAKASEKQLQPLKAMEWQFRKLGQKLHAPSAWQSLVTEFPELQSIASELGARAGGDERQVRHSLLQLYRRYAAEWERFSARERLGVRARAA
jgi:7-cyano-7-deazaguanine synthase in queuosine biosynthesis